MTTLSNWVKAIAPLASNALSRNGGTITGQLLNIQGVGSGLYTGRVELGGAGAIEFKQAGLWITNLYGTAGILFSEDNQTIINQSLWITDSGVELTPPGTFTGDAAGLTNLNASALSNGIIPPGILGTNITRTVGGIVTTGGVSAASFYGNGGSLTNVPWIYPWTQFYYHVNTDYTNWLRIAVASNEYTSAIEVCGVWQQTNDAASTYLYVRLNGLTGTNVMYSQGYTVNSGAAAPTSAQVSNDAPGWTACRFYCPANYTNAVADWSFKIKNIHGFTKTMSGRCFSKPRPIGGYANQFQEFYDGVVQFDGSVTQIEIFVWNATKPNTGSVTRAMNLPQ